MKLTRAGAALVIVAMGTAATPGGAAPARAADAAATVNGVSISVDEFETALEELGATGTVSGEEARTVLTEMIVNEAVRQELVAEGVDPDAGVEDADASAPASPSVIADRNRYSALLAETGSFDAEALRAEYEETAMVGGLMCLQLFVVDDVETGEDAMAELDDGAEFADVAVEYDPTFAQTGGSVQGDPSRLCFDTAGLAEAALPIVEAVTEAGAGEPVGPIETEIAIVIAVAPPFDEVSDSLDDSLVEPAIDEIVAAADVTVGPRYGRWDAATASVVPLGLP